ncbi:hypothetical protein N0V86_006820 [Didymella sp. IMI 355093]|nr:hypothetical protein N0V86_006820 [Didymella sp. IMI 355093]
MGTTMSMFGRRQSASTPSKTDSVATNAPSSAALISTNASADASSDHQEQRIPSGAGNASCSTKPSAANLVRYTLRKYGWKANDPVDHELRSMAYYTQMRFNKHILSKHIEFLKILKPIGEVLRLIGMAPWQMLGPLDLNKAEKLYGAMNEMFDVLEAQQWVNEEENAEFSAPTEGSEDSTATAENAKCQEGQEGQKTMPP